MKTRGAAATFAILMAVGLGAVQSAQAVDRTDDPVASDTFDTFARSTRHVTTVQRTDLPDADAPECGAPAVPPSLVTETSTALDPAIETIVTFGPANLFVGDDLQTPYTVVAGETHYNTITTYETLVTQYFQGVAEGPPCGVAVDPRFTG